jgi:hypothetical protein
MLPDSSPQQDGDDGPNPGYANDIFISYAHDDNHGLWNRPGWVDIFEQSLDSWLRRRRGMANLKIWRDTKRMRGNTLFDDAIQNALKTSALFFALTSRNYLQSDYCRKEMSWFHQYHSQRPGGLRVGEACRILNILLHNVPHEGWPAELQGLRTPMNDAGGEHLGSSPRRRWRLKSNATDRGCGRICSSANGCPHREQKMDIRQPCRHFYGDGPIPSGFQNGSLARSKTSMWRS